MKKSVEIIISIFTIIILLAGCGSEKPDKTAADRNEPFKLGAILIQTGTGSFWGNNSRKGVEVALEELNKAGGILGRKVKLILEDNPGNEPKSAVSAYQKLVTLDKTKFIIGPTWSTSSNAVAPAAADKDVVMISPSTGMATFNEAADNLFNVWPHDCEGAYALAEYAIKNGYTTAALFAVQDDWYIGMANFFKERFEKLGGEIKLSEQMLRSGKSFMTEATKLLHSDAQIAFLSIDFDMMGTFAMRARELGAKQKFLTTLMDADILASAGDALDGTIFVTYDEPTNEFKKTYKAFHNEEPGITADTAYDAVMILAKAIENANSFDTKTVVEKLLKTKDYRGASGIINFDAHGGVVKKPYYNIVDGFTMKRLEQQK